MEIMETIEEKTKLRKAMREKLKAMAPALRTALSQSACETIEKLPAFAEAEYVLAYMAMPHECDPAWLVERAWSSGKKVVFPVCEAEYKLGLYLPAGNDAFIRGKYGISEPEPLRCVRIELEKIDFAIIPGLAFDAHCARLGQGAGYYDRLLSNTDAFLLGLGFPSQIIARVPTLPHDRSMDAVITAEHAFFT